MITHLCKSDENLALEFSQKENVVSKVFPLGSFFVEKKIFVNVSKKSVET
jgi:hypothetical protein